MSFCLISELCWLIKKVRKCSHLPVFWKHYYWCSFFLYCSVAFTSDGIWPSSCLCGKLFYFFNGYRAIEIFCFFFFLFCVSFVLCVLRDLSTLRQIQFYAAFSFSVSPLSLGSLYPLSLIRILEKVNSISHIEVQRTLS